MSFVNLFAPSTAAIRSSSVAFKTIGDNIANSVTPGYKAADTRFSEMLVSSDTSLFDSYGGNRPVVQNFVDRQGLIETTRRPFDIAIKSPRSYFLVAERAKTDHPIARAFSGWLKSRLAEAAPGKAYSRVSNSE